MMQTQLRVARHTERLDELVRFYRDGPGLTEIGGFSDHDGYDGVFLEVPGTGAHLEFTSGGADPGPVPHPESLLVLYLGDADAVRAIVARLGSTRSRPPTRGGCSTESRSKTPTGSACCRSANGGGSRRGGGRRATGNGPSASGPM